MRATQASRRLSIIALVLLGLLAAALSVAALFSTRPVTPAPEASGPETTPAVATKTPDPEPTEEKTTEPEMTPTPEPSTPEAEETSEPPAALSVVVIGDSHSLGDPQETWVGAASEQLGWGNVTNLAAPGRGFYATPRSCDFTPCATFGGSVELIAEEEPDLVITFGGVADGDVALGNATAAYFEELRAALPDAELVAIAPISTADSLPYYILLHGQSLESAVTSVDGVFVDAGQPGIGGEATLSPEAHAQIAAALVGELGSNEDGTTQ